MSEPKWPAGEWTACRKGECSCKRLILAAPKLYKALDGMICPRCLNRIGWTGDKVEGGQDWHTCPVCEYSRSVLAEALGETDA